MKGCLLEDEDRLLEHSDRFWLMIARARQGKPKSFEALRKQITSKRSRRGMSGRRAAGQFWSRALPQVRSQAGGLARSRCASPGQGDLAFLTSYLTSHHEGLQYEKLAGPGRQSAVQRAAGNVP
jgi:hypothetical protein